jgi:signal transduction histidine kinase
MGSAARAHAADVAGVNLEITVEDDGPELAEGHRETVFCRGTRLDEQRPGSGLGLAIARDLAEIYGGRIELGRSVWGGLVARLSFPQVEQAFRSRADL